MLHRVLAVTVLTVLLGAVPAVAKTVDPLRFRTPGGQVHCYALKVGGEGLECMSRLIPSRGQLDPYWGLAPRGRTTVGERGDFPGYATKERVLRYGSTYRRQGIRCTLRRPTGLTCRNRGDHGFRLVDGDSRRF